MGSSLGVEMAAAGGAFFNVACLLGSLLGVGECVAAVLDIAMILGFCGAFLSDLSWVVVVLRAGNFHGLSLRLKGENHHEVFALISAGPCTHGAAIKLCGTTSCRGDGRRRRGEGRRGFGAARRS